MMNGPGFTQRPEIPEDRKSWARAKPWVDWKHWPRRLRSTILIVTPPAPRGRVNDPERTKAKRLAKRERQNKNRR